ncbi:MAG TPA: hypothetical protein VMW16_01120 [Sedimentisphaerales bacterium]|nr:hypothetical protein [Sedimentisphaerales bacterium]
MRKDMAKDGDMAKDTFLPDSVQRAFEGLIGFFYTVTIALVIERAYLDSGKFNSIVPAMFTLILLFFFACDWLAKFYNRLKMSGKMTESSTLMLLRLLLEITTVYFLLLVSLKLVEAYALLNWRSILRFLEITPSESLCWFMASFAILTGLWNIMMVGNSTQVNKEHIWCLFKGHLHKDIVKLFPSMRGWIDNLTETRVEQYERAAEKGQRVLDQTSSGRSNTDRGKELLEGQVEIRRRLGWRLLVQCLVEKPHHILLPYLFVFHIVTLNFVLGGFIVVSGLLLGSTSLLAKLPLIHAFSPVLLLLGASLSLLFLIFYYFKSDRNKSFSERFGCACLALTVLLFYSVCPAMVLIVLVGFQQIGANFIMTRYFKPSEEQDEGGPHATEVVEQGGHT